MSWVSSRALITMIGVSLDRRTSRMKSKPSMPPSMRSTSMRSKGLRPTVASASSADEHPTTS